MLNFIKNLLHSKAEAVDAQEGQKRKFLDVLAEFRDRVYKEDQLAPATLKHHDGRVRKITEFIKAHGYQDLLVDEIRIKHMEELRLWLRTSLVTCTNRHASLHLEYCRRATRYACRMGYLTHDPLNSIRTQRDKPKDVIALSREELDRLINTKFRHPFTSTVQDLFVFQCWTGLTYCDLYKYTVEQFEGQEWLTSQRTKTDSRYFVPLFPEMKSRSVLFFAMFAVAMQAQAQKTGWLRYSPKEQNAERTARVQALKL